jgi:aspartyl-tRNA(Asn)/glutamyl-tRNA(Gln) amidotransferase subunit A
MTIEELHKKIKNKEVSIRSIVEAYKDAIAKKEELNAFREVFDTEEQIAYAEKLFAEGKETLLTGVCIAIKDNILYAGHHAGASSKILESYVASYDATVIKALKEAGSIIIGRTNMDEFAMGSSTENSAYGPSKNPHDTSRVPGGSSGGSAVAVAADMAMVSLGSDTGGSIRQPAAFCGVVGLFPTYGTVSRHGLMAMGSSLDVIGPFANSVRDAEIVYDTISQYEPLDSTSIPSEGRVRNYTLKKRLAIPKGILSSTGLDEEVRENFKIILDKLTKEGYTIEEVDLEYYSDALSVYYILMPAEVSSNLARFDGIRYGDRIGKGTVHDIYKETRGALFGTEVRRRILLGTYVLSHGYYDAYYNKALELRKRIRKELEDLLQEYDALVTPTAPTLPFKIGEKVDDPVSMYLSDLFTVPANIAQHPGISVPTGKSKEGLPFAIQFVGPRFGEEILFKLGKVVENIR